MDMIKRFLNYVSFDTMSDEESNEFPSTKKQVPLLKLLEKELKELGLDACYRNGYTYGKLKSDCGKKDTLFLMAHVDTSPDASDLNVKPRIVHYDGTDIMLNETKCLNAKEFPNLINHLGHDLIVTDGTTLLGADDKAGIAIIMDTIEKAIEKKNYPNIIACFTPDEEIGAGTKYIDVDFIKEGTDKIYAYTLDGDDIKNFEHENFNAAQAKVYIEGRSIHPSIGKNKLINAQEVFMFFHSLLPKCRPENSEKREGFIHLCGSEGQVENLKASYILRSFDLEELESYKNSFYNARDYINKFYNKEIVKVEIKDQYRNMAEIINKNPYVVDIMHEVFKDAGIKWNDVPIRGGTDGATLSYKGIPCPNLGTGGDNFHGVYEYVDIEQMKQMVSLLMSLMAKLK